MYLSAKAIAAMQAIRRTHSLNDQAVRSGKSLGDVAGLKNIGVHWVSLEPGHQSTEYHFHHFEEECIYVLSGHATALLGDTSISIGPGDFLAHPIDHIAHQITNDGSENLIYLMIGQRLNQDITDYPKKKKRLYKYSGKRDVVDLTQEKK